MPDQSEGQAVGLDTVAAVVVTRDRPAYLRKCLVSLESQTAPVTQTVVVDNASAAPTKELLAHSAGIHVRRLDDNLGGAGGFAEGLRFARRFAPTWYWLMDDDCAPAPTALATMLDSGSAQAADSIGGIVPTVLWGDGHTMCGFLRSGAPAQSELADWGPFAGLLLRRVACDAVGDIREDFFIRHDDREYCLRLRRAGWLLMRSPEAVVEHPVWGQRRLTRRVMGRTVQTTDVPPWKEYYGVRNALLVALEDADGASGRVAVVGRVLKREAVACARMLVVDPAARRRVYWRLRGLVDGLRGRTGTVARPDVL